MKVDKPRFEKNARSVFYRRRRRAAEKTGRFLSSRTYDRIHAVKMLRFMVDLKDKKQHNSQPLSARSSVGSEYLATNQVVGGSNPSGRAILQGVIESELITFVH